MNTANVVQLSATPTFAGAKKPRSAPPDPVRVRFGAFELDEPNALLLRDGTPVTLAPKPFGLLCALARRPGSLLTKDALLDDVWGHQFVSDSVLRTAITEVRTVLDDHARSPRFIETVSRRGYRFIAATTAMSTDASERGVCFTQPTTSRSHADTEAEFHEACDLPCMGSPSACPLSKTDRSSRNHEATTSQPVYPTMDQIRYAHELKIQLRARLLRDASATTHPWCVGAD